MLNPVLRVLRFWRSWISVIAPVVLIAIPLTADPKNEKVKILLFRFLKFKNIILKLLLLWHDIFKYLGYVVCLQYSGVCSILDLWMYPPGNYIFTTCGFTTLDGGGEHQRCLYQLYEGRLEYWQIDFLKQIIATRFLMPSRSCYQYLLSCNEEIFNDETL